MQLTGQEIRARYMARLALVVECAKRGMSFGDFEKNVEKSLSLRRLRTEVFAGYGPRGIGAVSGQMAAGDKHLFEFQYNDTSGSLSIGMPLFVDVTDAAEWNNLWTTTALSPAAGATGGKVLLSTNSNATNSYYVGIFAPDDQNVGLLPAKGDVVRVAFFGRFPVSVAAKASGTAVLVGDILITDTTQTSLLSGHNTYTAGKTAAIALATSTAVATTNSIVAVPGSGTTTAVINGFVRV
jgi:hypothetical protein